MYVNKERLPKFTQKRILFNDLYKIYTSVKKISSWQNLYGKHYERYNMTKYFIVVMSYANIEAIDLPVHCDFFNCKNGNFQTKYCGILLILLKI